MASIAADLAITDLWCGPAGRISGRTGRLRPNWEAGTAGDEMHATTDLQTAASDEALLVAFANGDARAARDLTARLTPRVFRFALRMLGGDRAEAEDVTQEALLRLWKIAGDWRQGEAKVSTWLYRVTSNLCTDRLRKRGRSVDLDAVAEPEDDRPGAYATLLAKDRAAALEAALATLPARQRQAVVLRHLEGLGNPEIAEIMDIGIAAVESLTARGKKALASALGGRREDLGYDDA